MSLSHQEMKKLADLARLQLTDEELAKIEREFDSILEYIGRLQEIDTRQVEPMAMPPKAEGWRKDEAFTCDDATRELILSNFPARSGDALSVPAVFEKPKK